MFTLVKLHKMLFSLTIPKIVVVSKLFLLYRNENNGPFTCLPITTLLFQLKRLLWQNLVSIMQMPVYRKGVQWLNSPVSGVLLLRHLDGLIQRLNFLGLSCDIFLKIHKMATIWGLTFSHWYLSKYYSIIQKHFYQRLDLLRAFSHKPTY